MLKGKFIVIDGSDGSGKKTQTDLLIKYLKTNHHTSSYFDFPQYQKSFFGKMVGRYLNGEFGEADDVNPYLASLLYAGDRWQASEAIRKDLKAGKIVIANRYTQSNMGFQTAKIKSPTEKRKFLSWVTKLEYQIYGIPKPDLVVYLYVPYKIAQSLVDKKADRGYTKMKRDIHERNGEYLNRVEKQYLTLARQNKEWQIVNCIQDGKLMTPPMIAELVAKEVKKII